MSFRRMPGNPIVHPGVAPEIGSNINGPSLIRVPSWLPRPLGKYYLYFAHHGGTSIRLAYADSLTGPWRIHVPGTLQLDQTPCHHHIASPDVHIDQEGKRIVMYYHGPVLGSHEAARDPLTLRFPFLGGQRSLAATSPDGIHFTSRTPILGPSYLRAFRWQGMVYALCMPGIFYRSPNGFDDFEEGPTLFNADMRHAALRVVDDELHIYYTQVGDCPEQILRVRTALVPDWSAWRTSEPEPILAPALDYEGAGLPLVPSRRGAAHEPVRQLRDPALFEEAEKLYLIYSVAGEQGLAMAVQEESNQRHS